jgi:hypothetical protein
LIDGVLLVLARIQSLLREALASTKVIESFCLAPEIAPLSLQRLREVF